MSFPYRLVATDLDGTLLRDDGTVSSRTRDAIAATSAAGAAHIVVTGRNVPWTQSILAGLDYTGLAVCGQGGQLYHAGERRLLTSVTLDRRLASTAVEEIERVTGPLELAASRDGVEGEVVASPAFEVEQGSLRLRHVNDRSELWAEPLTKVYLQHPVMSDDELTKTAREVAGHLTDVIMAGPGVVELLPPGLNKARGLSLAARRLGLRGARTIAFGDMPNDIPMFHWASHGVAMADAHPELLAVADEVTASNDDDGVAVVLERLLAAS